MVLPAALVRVLPVRAHEYELADLNARIQPQRARAQIADLEHLPIVYPGRHQARREVHEQPEARHAAPALEQPAYVRREAHRLLRDPEARCERRELKEVAVRDVHELRYVGAAVVDRRRERDRLRSVEEHAELVAEREIDARGANALGRKRCADLYVALGYLVENDVVCEDAPARGELAAVDNAAAHENGRNV